MKGKKFSSQICTTKEQSKQLLELGLKPETADMVWHHNERSKLMEWELRPFSPTLRSNTILNITKLNVFNHKNEEGKVMTGEEYFDKLYGKDVPAWSLHRLMEITDFTNHTFLDLSIAYDVLIERIVAQVRFNMQNKEYFNRNKE